MADTSNTTPQKTEKKEQDAQPHIFGIRHHGPGSARSLRHALTALQPDMVLIEGPPDAADVLPLLTHADMQPPVALLIYVPDKPQLAAFYPFAIFSPEWQALHYSLTNSVPVRFIDLAQAHRIAIMEAMKEAEQQEQEQEQEQAQAPMPSDATPSDADAHADTNTDSADAQDATDGDDTDADTPDATGLDMPMPDVQAPTSISVDPRQDPLGFLAEAAGYSDGERWWDHVVEQRRNSTDLFAAILEAMTVLREEIPPREDPLEEQREAAMRQAIRTAQREGYRTIAVVCGAWHAPALANMPKARDDAAMLKKLPKVKVQATWVPWTYSRLSYASGYGAGIESPGWYHHLWTADEHVVISWVSHAARLLRGEDLDASSAHIIEAVRLSEALAALRDRPLPGLPELNEAIQTVFCFGSSQPMELIYRKLIVGERMGAVPDDTPMVPLQRDVQREQKRLRMKPSADMETITLDLRKQNHLERSHLLHRLNLLGISWGHKQHVSGKSGTFNEVWQVQWHPEFEIVLIEKSVWGTTVYEAVTAYIRHSADEADYLPTLTKLVAQLFPADLPDAVAYVLMRLQEQAALSSEVAHLMEALPPLAYTVRYPGIIQQTDVDTVQHVVDELVVRICVGLPSACASLNDEAAETMLKHVIDVNEALVAWLQDEEHTAMWHKTLVHLAEQQGMHGLLAGRCCRLLLDAGVLSIEEIARRMGLAMALANEPAHVAAWIDGFVRGSATILLHDDTLWHVLDDWVTTLSADMFTAVLPLLRRTFATFAAPERRQMGERVRVSKPGSHSTSLANKGQGATPNVDVERAERVLPIVAQVLGLRDG